MSKLVHQVGGATHHDSKGHPIVFCTCGEYFEGWNQIQMKQHIQESNKEADDD